MNVDFLYPVEANFLSRDFLSSALTISWNSFLKAVYLERQKFSRGSFAGDNVRSKTNNSLCSNKKLPILFIFLKLKSRQSGSHGKKGSKMRYKCLRPITLRPILSDSLPFSAFLKFFLIWSPS